MFISQAFAQTADAAAGGPAGLLNSPVAPLVFMFVVFYFLLLRPQQKKLKAHKEMISQLRRGDQIVTQGGLIGKVSKIVDDAELLVELADNVKVKLKRSAVAEVVVKGEPVAAEGDATKDAAK